MHLNPKATELFERWVNLVRQHASRSCLCFNSSAHDAAEAVERQLE